MPNDNKFPKSLRLKKNREFRSVFLCGKRYAYGSVTVFALKEKDKKIGISVSSKKIKTAVRRNKIKRILREIVRKEKNNIPDNQFIVFLYNRKEVLDYASIYKDVNHLIQKLQ